MTADIAAEKKPPPQNGECLAARILTENLEKPSLDDRSYRVIQLSNKLEALLVSDPDTDKSSAALDVNVGNFSDPGDMPGVAHAVEHLLFMGTKKYPEENAYNQYLSANSGSSNAYTSSTSTNFFFDVASQPHNGGEASATNVSPLYGALDRFAQFFIDPSFLENTVDRELRAVDSENKKNLQNDAWRTHQLEKSISDPRHPHCKFTTGNFEVLKVEPEARGVNIRETFIAFHNKHYSANHMKLVVLGREPLDVLQDWVAELFSAIPNKDLPVKTWTDVVPYGPNYLGLQIFVKPVMDSRELVLRFPFPDESELFKTQPSRYISHLIGHEGPGSIMAYIKSKGWANGLGAGLYPICPGTHSIFEVSVRLTEEGLKDYKEIIKVFFQYVAMLQESEPLEWVFDEQKGMADVDFKFKQKTPASRFTSRTSALMQRRTLPREWLLSGLGRLREFNAQLIRNALNCIAPENLRISLTSRTFPGDWDKKEKWYGTEYKVEKISEDLMADIRRAHQVPKQDRISALHLPHRNQFIPTKLEVEKKEVKEPALAPRIIRSDALARTWFKKDDTFWVPKGTLTVSIRSPIIFSTAENFIKTSLFTELVRDALEEYSYDADLAGLLYGVTLEMHALLVEVSGYNDKLPVLLEQVLITMRDLEIKDDRFAIIKERSTRALRNYAFQQPYLMLPDYMSWLMSPTSLTVEEMSQVLTHITADSMQHFSKDLLGQLHIEVHVHGNMYKEEALRLTDMVESTLKPRALPQAEWPVWREVVLPPGSNYMYEKTLEDEANVNNALEYYLHLGSRADRRTRALTLLLGQLTQEPAWDKLRTKEQLGYVVFSNVRSGTSTIGFRLLVQSEKVPHYLEDRFDNFLTEYATTLAEMSAADFEGHKRSLIVKRLEKPKNLNQETARHWSQIYNEWYDFECAQKDTAEIKAITQSEMLDFYNHYVHPTSPHRAKLCVHLVAKAKSDATSKQISDLVKALDLDDEKAERVKVDLQARLDSLHNKDAATVDDAVEKHDYESLRGYLVDDIKALPGSKVDAAVETWKSLASYHKSASANSNDAAAGKREPNGTMPIRITNIRDFRSSLTLTTGPIAIADISEFMDVDAKL